MKHMNTPTSSCEWQVDIDICKAIKYGGEQLKWFSWFTKPDLEVSGSKLKTWFLS